MHKDGSPIIMYSDSSKSILSILTLFLNIYIFNFAFKNVFLNVHWSNVHVCIILSKIWQMFQDRNYLKLFNYGKFWNSQKWISIPEERFVCNHCPGIRHRKEQFKFFLIVT